MEVLLRNRSGLPQHLPTTYLRREGSGVSLLVGMEFRLSRSAQLPTDAEQNSAEIESHRRWDPVPQHAERPFPPGDRGKLLQPTESFPAFSVKLDELYRLKEPGLYRLQVVWAGGTGGLAEGKSNEIRFVLAP